MLSRVKDHFTGTLIERNFYGKRKSTLASSGDNSADDGVRHDILPRRALGACRDDVGSLDAIDLQLRLQVLLRASITALPVNQCKTMPNQSPRFPPETDKPEMLSRSALRASSASAIVARRGFHTTPHRLASPFHYPEGPRSNIPFNPLTRFFAVRYWGFMGMMNLPASHLRPLTRI